MRKYLRPETVKHHSITAATSRKAWLVLVGSIPTRHHFIHSM